MASIAIIGMGAVGTACARAILSSGLAETLALHDRDADRAVGESVDFDHGAPLLPECRIRGAGLDEMEPADIAILTAGYHSSPGQTRLALIDRNVEVVDEIAAAMERAGLPRVVVVVTNPVDPITEYLTRRWEDRPVRVLGTGTSLDSWRLVERIAEELGAHPANVHAWVVGEHGDSSVFLFSSATIGAFSLPAFAALRGIDCTPQWLDRVREDVRSAAYRVIALKGASTEAIALATARLVEHMVREPGFVVPVSVRVEEGLCASLPAVVDRDGAQAPFVPDMDPDEARAWERSLDVLRDANQRLPV